MTLFKPKYITEELIMTISSSKSHFKNVILLYRELVITQPEVNLGEVTRSLELIKKIINRWNRILFLNGNLFYLEIVNAHSKRIILLLNKQYWSPHWEILDLLNLANKCFNWSFNSFKFCWGHIIRRNIDWLCILKKVNTEYFFFERNNGKIIKKHF